MCGGSGGARQLWAGSGGGRGGGGGQGAGSSNLTHNSDTEEDIAAEGTAAEAGRREGSLSAVLVGRKRRRVVEDSDSEGEVAEAGEAAGRGRMAMGPGRLGGGGKRGWVT